MAHVRFDRCVKNDVIVGGKNGENQVSEMASWKWVKCCFNSYTLQQFITATNRRTTCLVQSTGSIHDPSLSVTVFTWAKATCSFSSCSICSLEPVPV